MTISVSKSPIIEYFKRAGLCVLLVNALGLPLALLVQIVLSRVLGAEQLGIYELVLGWTSTLVMFATLGADLVVLRWLPALKEESQKANATIWAVKRSLKGSALLCPLLFIAAALAFYLGKQAHGFTLLVAGLLLPLWSQNIVRQSLLRSLHKPVIAKAPDVILKPLAIIVFVLILSRIYPQHLYSTVAFASHFFGALLVFLLGTYFLKKNISLNKAQSKNPSAPGTAIILMFCLAFQVASIELEKTLLGFFSTSEAVAWYALAARYSLLAVFFHEALAVVVIPQISSLAAQGNKEDLQKILKATAYYSVAGAVLLGMLLWGVSDWLIGLSGQEFLPAKKILLVIIFAQILGLYWGSVIPVMQTLGNEKDFLRLQLTVLCAQVIVSTLLILQFGAIGAAWGQMFALTLRGILANLWVQKNLQVKLRLV